MKNKISKKQQVLYVKMFGDFSLEYQGRSLIAKKKKETQFAERHSSSLCFSGTARAPAAKLLLIVLSIIPPKTVKVSAESFFFPIFFFQTNGRTCPTTVAVPP